MGTHGTFFVYEEKLQENSGKGTQLWVSNWHGLQDLCWKFLYKSLPFLWSSSKDDLGMRNDTDKHNWFSKNQNKQSGFKIFAWEHTVDQKGIPPLCAMARQKGCFYVLNTPHSPSGDTVQRTVKYTDGHWVSKNISVPPAVKEYSRYILYNQQSFMLFETKSNMWLSIVFSSYTGSWVEWIFQIPWSIITKSSTRTRSGIRHCLITLWTLLLWMPSCFTRILLKVKERYQKAFRETLFEELAAAAKKPGPSSTPRSKHHKPLHLTAHSTIMGHLRCRQCHAKTPVKCSSCDIPFCFVPNRECYNFLHDANNLLI